MEQSEARRFLKAVGNVPRTTRVREVHEVIKEVPRDVVREVVKTVPVVKTVTVERRVTVPERSPWMEAEERALLVKILDYLETLEARLAHPPKIRKRVIRDSEGFISEIIEEAESGA